MITKPMLAPTDPVDLGACDHYPIQYPVLASPKFDGIRCLRVSNQTLSRKFKPIKNQHVQKLTVNLPNGLDGELMLDGKPFNEVSSAIMSEDGEPDFRYYVFDYVGGALTEPYIDRVQKLKNLTLPPFCVKVIPVLIKNEAELIAYEQQCLAQGYEGVMIRHPQGCYKCGRATVKQGWLLKVKRFTDSEAEIVGFEEQMHNTNEAEEDELGHTKRSKAKAGLVPAGTLGKLIVREIGDNPWKGKTFGMGTGFDAAMRQEIWDNRDKYLGRIVTYKFQNHGIVDLPRLPVWKGFRSQDDM